MIRRKLALIMVAAVTINCISPSLRTFASGINEMPVVESTENENSEEETSNITNDEEKISENLEATDEVSESDDSEDKNEILISEENISDIKSEKAAADVVTEAAVNKFTIYNSEYKSAYDKEFKIDNSRIENISNNGGQYGSSSIDKSIDGDLNTHFETGRPNSSDFTNEVVFEFTQTEEINRIIYKSRNGCKGFAKEFEVYGAENDDDFELVSYGHASVTDDLIEIKFETTEFKKLKFVFKEANEDWAAAGEFMFYAEDIIGDKVESLFTDSSLSEVSSEFNSLEEIEELEAEVKNHPLYEMYKENIENAKLLLSQADIESSEAVISTFDIYNSESASAYNEFFKIDNSKILNISNNAGCYGDSSIDKAFDGDLNTHFETDTPNSSTFYNEVNVEFKSLQSLNRIVYKSRNGCKGFAEEFEIYGSRTTKGDTFELVSFGTASVTDNLVEIKFDETEFKRLKFVFKKANEDWAAAGEFMFYTQDSLTDKVNNLFTDNTYSKLNEEFNDINIINDLEAEAVSHPLYSKLKINLDLAKELLNNGVNTEGTIIVAEQHGDMASHANNNLLFSLGSNRQPTGLLAKSGDKIVIYVDADSNSPLPKVIFTQNEGEFEDWERTIELKIGRNEITAPEFYVGGEYINEVTNGGLLYISNPYTAEQQGKAPVLRFEGVERVPYLTADTDVAEFKEFLIDYKNRLDEDKILNPNMKYRQVIDTFEFMSDHLIFTGTASGAYEAYIERGINPLDTIASYNKYMNLLFEFYGLDRSSEVNDPMYIRENVRLMQPFGYMYAAGNHIGVQTDVMANLLVPFEESGSNWGITHEIGHRMDMGVREYAEITNNMLPMLTSIYYGNMDERIPYESGVYKNVIKEDSKAFENKDFFEQLAVFWQLELYQNGYWADFNKLYREKPVKIDSNNFENSKMQYVIKYSSEVLNLDLSEYFARHGFTVNDETAEELGRLYEKPSSKLWYLNNSAVGYEGSGFNEGSTVAVELHADKLRNTNTLNLSVNKESADDLLGYEILRDGEIMGFTANSTFVDTDVDTANNYTYKVMAYDKKLNTIESNSTQGFSPILSAEKEVTLELHEEFNPLNYVDAVSHEGENLKNSIRVISNDVDIHTAGTYEVTYSITDLDITVEKTIKVNITSNYDYASDMSIESLSLGWGRLGKDTNLDGGTISLLRDNIKAEYSKGLTAHANSEITYNVEGKKYKYFESYIGIDHGSNRSAASATFEVYVDGEKKFDSSVFKFDTNSQFVRVNIENAKEVKLVTTDANDGNAADHTVWAEAKFITDSSLPVLNIPDSMTVKVGESIDLNEGYSAFDTEDGDLTSAVEISGIESVDFNKTGRYTLTYKVTDSDGNEVVQTRTISVVDMEDYDYLTDYDWSSIDYSYTDPLKDLTVDWNALRLTNEDGSIETYERGIGAHSTSTITYDLNNKNYDYFSSFVGVDREMYDSAASVSFEVYVDGEKKFDSGVMYSTDAKKYLEVDITGASELKLVVTDGYDGDGSDHATWGDAKLHFAR